MGDANRIRSTEELAVEERLRQTTDGLPEVKIKQDKFGHITFRVNDKPFIFLGEGTRGVHLSTKTMKDLAAKLVAEGPYTRTRYIGQHGWVSFDLCDVEWDEVEQRVVESFWRAAPKRLIRSHGQG